MGATVLIGRGDKVDGFSVIIDGFRVVTGNTAVVMGGWCLATRLETLIGGTTGAVVTGGRTLLLGVEDGGGALTTLAVAGAATPGVAGVGCGGFCTEIEAYLLHAREKKIHLCSLN